MADYVWWVGRCPCKTGEAERGEAEGESRCWRGSGAEAICLGSVQTVEQVMNVPLAGHIEYIAS